MNKPLNWCIECLDYYTGSPDEHFAKVHNVPIVYSDSRRAGYKIYPKLKKKRQVTHK